MTDTSAPLFSFGIVADPQYADIPSRPDRGRFYSHSLNKLADAIEVFNAHELAFVVTLGDIIDRGWESFDAILSHYDALRHRSVMVPGNHDFSVEPHYLLQVHARLQMPQPWYDFSVCNIRFIVLDGNDVSLFAPPPGDARRDVARQRLNALQQTGAINAHDWNGSFSDEQMRWLAATLSAADAAGENALLFCHYPLYPQNAHNMWDAPAILSLLTAHDCVKAWFCGHNHDGNYGLLAGRHFVNLKGMVDTPDENSFAIADIHPDRIELRGFGRQDSRTLLF